MPKTTYIIDFDSTLVTVESLDELANIALEDHPDREQVVAELKDITDMGMSGKITFDESLRRRLKLFRANRQHVQKATDFLQERISPSALAHAEWFEENSENIYVISGGFEEYIVPVVQKLGVRADHIFANRFVYDVSDNIVGYDHSRLPGQASGKAKQAEALRLPKPIVVIGDGFTDYEIKSRGIAQAFWAFTETTNRDSIVARADRVLPAFGAL